MAMTDMIQEQIERRRKRGKDELKRIVNQGNHPVLSVFAVTSTSGQTYQVRIHDLEALQNTCTCSDYRTNLIGTCKHIEGVLIQLREKYEAKLDGLAAERPSTTRIYLHYARDVTVRVSQPLPKQPELHQLLDRYFDAESILQGPVLHMLPALVKDRKPSADLPSPREVHAALVDEEHLPADLAARLSHVRELTAPPADDEEVEPLSDTAAEGLISTVSDLLDLGQQRLVEQGL